MTFAFFQDQLSDYKFGYDYITLSISLNIIPLLFHGLADIAGGSKPDCREVKDWKMKPI
jgi:hypothetical protein